MLNIFKDHYIVAYSIPTTLGCRFLMLFGQTFTMTIANTRMN